MIAYGIGILPNIKNIKQSMPDVTHTWYDDDAEYLGTFSRLETYFDSLTRQDPGWGYHPKPKKKY